MIKDEMNDSESLIEELRKAMSDKRLSPEQAAGYIGSSGNQIRRWLKGLAKPTPLYRAAIITGIKKIKHKAI